ncbi:MAG: hypothetical protein ACYCVO_15660 [Acidimicrobiales bacterium]
MAVDPSSHVVVELSGTSTTVEVHRILAEAAAARSRAGEFFVRPETPLRREDDSQILRVASC